MAGDAKYREERELHKNEGAKMDVTCTSMSMSAGSGYITIDPGLVLQQWNWGGAEEKNIKQNSKKIMKEKYYRVKKDTPAWDVGAVITNKDIPNGSYKAINELYNKEHAEDYVEFSKTVENSPEWFERVYPVSLVSKVVYKLKEEAREMLSKEHTA